MKPDEQHETSFNEKCTNNCKVFYKKYSVNFILHNMPRIKQIYFRISKKKKKVH